VLDDTDPILTVPSPTPSALNKTSFSTLFNFAAALAPDPFPPVIFTVGYSI